MAENGAPAETVFSQLRTCVRSNYSNPPVHGAAIVATILGDAALSAQWEQEVAAMRDRINREEHGAIYEAIKAKDIERARESMRRHIGKAMGRLGLTKD